MGLSFLSERYSPGALLVSAPLSNKQWKAVALSTLIWSCSFPFVYENNGRRDALGEEKTINMHCALQRAVQKKHKIF